MYRLTIMAMGIVGALLTPPLNEAGAQDVDADELLAVFDAVALGGPDNDQGRIYRWKDGISVRFTGAAAVRHLEWAENQLLELQQLSGLDIRREDSIGADLLVVFVGTFDEVLEGLYNDLIDEFVAGPERRTALLSGFRDADAVCAGQIVASGSRLSGGIVFIPRDQLSPVVRSCISAQFARVMGLPFAAPEHIPSALAAASPYAHLTRLDQALLRLLYHPRMKAGLARDDALTIARSVSPELLTSGQ